MQACAVRASCNASFPFSTPAASPSPFPTQLPRLHRAVRLYLALGYGPSHASCACPTHPVPHPDCLPFTGLHLTFLYGLGRCLYLSHTPTASPQPPFAHRPVPDLCVRPGPLPAPQHVQPAAQHPLRGPALHEAAGHAVPGGRETGGVAWQGTGREPCVTEAWPTLQVPVQ